MRNLLGSLGIPVLIPWLITGGPEGSGLWWSLVYVIWIFFITNKKWNFFWLLLYLFLCFSIIGLSEMGIITIAYSVNELLNLLFAFIFTATIVYFFNQVIEYYIEICNTHLKKIKKSNEVLEKTDRILKIQNKQLIDFCNIVSHNLRAPMVNIALLTEYIEESDDEDEKKDMISKIRQVSLHLNEIYNELVESLQVHQDTKIKSENIMLKDCLDEILIGFESKIESSEATIQIDLNDVSKIYFPKKYLDSILTNLISNALKYKSPDRKPLIKIKTEKLNGSVILSVADNGMGFDFEMQKDKLFKINTVFHKHPEAKGFGLFTIKNQIEAMEGKIWAESIPDKGSTFFVEFINQNNHEHN